MQPNINDMLYIKIATEDWEEAQQEYKAKIVDVQDPYIVMEAPANIESGKLKRLDIKEQLTIYYENAEGVKHYFDTEVQGQTKNVIQQYMIKKPEPEAISKVQKRNFLRVPAKLDISVNLKNKIHIVVKTQDVGGGGISFICSERYPLKRGDALICWLVIQYKDKSIEHCKFIGEVVRVKPTAHSLKHLVMMKFKDIEESEQQKIIRYCFEHQLKQRK